MSLMQINGTRFTYLSNDPLFWNEGEKEPPNCSHNLRSHKKITKFKFLNIKFLHKPLGLLYILSYYLVAGIGMVLKLLYLLLIKSYR